MDRIPIKDPITPDKEEFVDGLDSILEDKDLTTGKYTKAVEKKLADIHDCKHVVFFDSATTAFYLLVKSYLKHNHVKRIKMQDFTWKSTKDIIRNLCWKDKLTEFMDIDPDTWIWWDDVEENELGIPNLSFGNRGSWDEIQTPGNLILDASYSFGDKGVPNPRMIGVPDEHREKEIPAASNLRDKEPAWGAIMSFSSAKPVSACEGGAVLTDRTTVERYVRKNRRYHGRPSELNALFLLRCIQKSVPNFMPWKSNSIADDYNVCLDDKYEMQKVATHHTRGEIVCTADIDREGLGEFMEVKQRYKPSGLINVLENTAQVYNNSLVLPQGGPEIVEKVSEELNERA